MITQYLPNVFFKNLGIIDYKECWDYQEKLLNEIVEKKIKNQYISEKEYTPNYLLFCEHPHVYTLGKSGKENNLLLKPSELEKKKISYYKNNRGGDITYHGPGQLIAYPIFNLEYFYLDIHRFLRDLEECIILLLGEYQINAGRIDGLTGVWVNCIDTTKARKICSIGVRTSRWVTMHGLALNVNSDLSYFENIVPCGIKDVEMTSMKKELGFEIDKKIVEEKLIKNFEKIFQIRLL